MAPELYYPVLLVKLLQNPCLTPHCDSHCFLDSLGHIQNKGQMSWDDSGPDLNPVGAKLAPQPNA